MTVSQRLYLAVLPAILGVFTVAALAYWGQYGRQAPGVLVVIAIVASVTSLVVAWRNTRDVATRLTRLAAPVQSAKLDELDRIEGEVERLRLVAAAAESSRAEATGTADRRVAEYAALVGDAASAVSRQLDDVRMPLHILLESHFGDLNENQEEMLAAARAAADEVHERLDRLRAIGEVDRGTLRVRLERLRLTDLVAILLPGLTATATRSGVRVVTDISPLAPAIVADRAWLTEALSLLATDAIARTASGSEIRIVSTDAANAGDRAIDERSGDAKMVRLALTHGSRASRTIDVALADHLIAAQHGHVTHEADRTVVMLAASGETAAVRPARSQTSR